MMDVVRLRSLGSAALAAVVLLVGGCAAQSQRGTVVAASGPQGSVSAQVDDAPAAAQATAAPTGRSYVVSAMVGQVNGRPIYAQSVFEPIADVLAAMGRRLPRSEFRREAAERINGRLQEIVVEALIIGEAERNLSQQERGWVQHMLKQKREELLRQWGNGSLSVANHRSMESDGVTIEQRLEEQRQRLIVGRYTYQKILPQISVTRRDIERYYHDNYDRYNAPMARTIHMIRVAAESAADQVDRRLAEGESFLDIASDARLNRNNPQAQGLFMANATGDEVFGEPLNAVMLQLEAGQHSQRVAMPNGFAWIYIREITGGERRSLREVYLEIDQILRRQQEFQLTVEYRERLAREGSYNPIHEMVNALTEVAMARWARPE